MSFHRLTGLPLALVAIAGVSGCIETTQSGLPSGARTKYAPIAEVPNVGDRVLSSYWAGAFSEPMSVEGRLGWSASAGTARLVRDQLEPAGAEEARSRTYKPRFVVRVRNPGASKAMIGENACTVGLSASLADPATGKSISSGAQVLGRTIIPENLRHATTSGCRRARKRGCWLPVRAPCEVPRRRHRSN